MKVPQTAQGPAIPLDPQSTDPAVQAEIDKDIQVGFTHKNLHRRMKLKSEYTPPAIKYELRVQSNNSYRTKEDKVHEDGPFVIPPEGSPLRNEIP